MEAGRLNEVKFFIGKCTSEKDLEKLKDLRGRNLKENISGLLDEHFAELQAKKGKR
jgi:hypothetical protein